MPGFFGFCLKIPNPNQYAIGIGKIPILTSVLINTQEDLRDCAIIIRRGGGAEKLELSSENLDSTPPPKQKKLVLAPLC